jgi:5-methylcytosine-specific restriction endonuclease McrA
LPKSRGGEKSWTNLVAACKKCNQKKGCRTPQECGMIPIRQPKRPKTTYIKNDKSNK